MPILQLDTADTWQITCERITSWRTWRFYLFGPWINQDWRKNLWISDYFGCSDITFEQHIHERVLLHQKSFPNFMNGWAHFRWIQRRFVQTRPSIIDMTCRHSTECTLWRDFQLDHTHRIQMEPTWVFDCSKAFSRHSWIHRPKIWARPLCHKSHLASWCARQQQWETHR